MLSQLQDRSLLDSSDKRLHTACIKQGVRFIWPNCLSGRSCDESDNELCCRRELLKNSLDKARRNSRKNNPRIPSNQPSQNSDVVSISNQLVIPFSGTNIHIDIHIYD